MTNTTEPNPIRVTTEYEYKDFILFVRSIPTNSENKTYVGHCYDIGYCLASHLEKEDIVASFKLAVDEYCTSKDSKIVDKELQR